MTGGLKERATRFLRWSEKYTKTDMVYLAQGGFWSLVGQGVSTFGVLLLAIVVARYFPKEAYGEYKYVLAIVALLGVFSLNGLGGAVFQSVAHGFEGALQDGFWKNIRWSALMIAGTIILSAYYFVFHNYTLAFGILIGGCLSPWLASANLASSFLMGKRDFRRDALYFGVIDTILPAAALILTAFLTDSALALIAVYFTANTLSTFYVYWLTQKAYRPDAQKKDAGMLTYGKHLSAIGILGTIAGNIDQILLFHFVGAAELAVYNFAVAIPDQTKGPIKMLDSMAQARFAAHADEHIHASMRNKMILIFSTTLLAVLAYIITAPFIFAILFPSYTEAVLYSQIYAVSLLGYAVTPLSSYFSIRKKVSQQYVWNAAVSVFQIAAMLIGVLSAGLLGLVLARVSTRIFSGLLIVSLYTRESLSQGRGTAQ